MYNLTYWEYVCDGGSGGGGGGNPPGGGGNPPGQGDPGYYSCPSTVSVANLRVDATMVGDSGYVVGTTTGDWTLTVRITGPGAVSYELSGPGAFTFPVDLTAISLGTASYTVTASASAAGCATVSATGTAEIARSSATAIANTSAGFYSLPMGGTFLIGTATISGYDAYEILAGVPAGWNVPTLWSSSAVERVSISPQYQQTQVADVSAWHDIAYTWYFTMLPMQGSYLPADDPWNKTYAASHALWVGPPPVQTTSGLDWVRFTSQGPVVSPVPAPAATATLE